VRASSRHGQVSHDAFCLWLWPWVPCKAGSIGFWRAALLCDSTRLLRSHFRSPDTGSVRLWAASHNPVSCVLPKRPNPILARLVCEV
jgi:hypothetical protein